MQNIKSIFSKSTHSRTIPVLILGLIMPMILVTVNVKKASAAATCYAETNVAFQVQRESACPTARAEVIYLDANGNSTGTPSSGCYLRRLTQANYTVSTYKLDDCNVMTQLAAAYEKSICQSSGGSWVNAEGLATGMCQCESGYKLNTLIQCTEITEDPVIPYKTDVSGIPGGDCEGGTIDECIQNTPFVQNLTNGINFLTALAGIAIIGSIILGAIKYSMSGGDPKKASDGRERIYNAMIALLGLLLLFSFLQWIIPGGAFN